MTSRTEKIYFDATLTPNRSLSPRAFLIVMCIVGGVSFLAGMMFLSMGAFPVLGFFGLDALLIYLCFRFSQRSQRQVTRVKVTTDKIDLVHEEPGRKTKSAQIPTAFARVNLEFPERAPSELQIAYRGQAWVIGRFLTPGERKSLKKALEDAIFHARNERYPA
ncbi:MAG: DUF2244 domain-containing protein [Pseudomonadota bacterium]